MAEFKAGAELDITVPDEQLRSARTQIERELGDVGVSVDAGVAGSAGQPRDPDTGQFASPMGPEEFERTSINLDEDRNDILEDILDELQGGDVLAGAGGGGGGIGTGLGIGGGAGIGAALVSGLTTGGALAGGAGVAGLATFLGQEVTQLFPGGEEVVDRRRRTFDPAAIQENPGQFIQDFFRFMDDPTGIGEVTTNLSSELLKTGLGALDDLTAEDLIEEPLSLQVPDVPAALGPLDFIEDTLSLTPPELPSRIGPRQLMEFLFGDGSGGTGPGPGNTGIPGAPRELQPGTGGGDTGVTFGDIVVDVSGAGGDNIPGVPDQIIERKVREAIQRTGLKQEIERSVRQFVEDQFQFGP